MAELEIVPITLKTANDYVTELHRHHGKSTGHKYSIGLIDNQANLRGVVIVGRPVARALDDGRTAEVTRLCTDGTANACSMLYAAAAQTAKAMGYVRIITYTLASETGTSLRASNWKQVAQVKGQSWSRPSRTRIDNHPTSDKIRWERQLRSTRSNDHPNQL